MKKLPFAALIGITAFLSGCACDCEDDIPIINFQFEGFSAEELKTIYVVNAVNSNACSNCLVFSGNFATLEVSSNIRFQLKSDSIPLNKIVQVNDIRTETAKFSACDCTNITGIDYELDGDKYTSEPIVITR